MVEQSSGNLWHENISPFAKRLYRLSCRGLFISSSLRGKQRMRKLGMGVVGVGDMGKRHAENLRRLVPQAQLLAVADVDGARASKVAAQLEIEHSYSSLEAMLERKDIQAIVIASPDKFHAGAV